MAPRVHRILWGAVFALFISLGAAEETTGSNLLQIGKLEGRDIPVTTRMSGSLEEVFQTLAMAGGFELELKGEGFSKEVTADFQKITLEEALLQLGREHALKFQVPRPGKLVVSCLPKGCQVCFADYSAGLTQCVSRTRLETCAGRGSRNLERCVAQSCGKGKPLGSVAVIIPAGQECQEFDRDQVFEGPLSIVMINGNAAPKEAALVIGQSELKFDDLLLGPPEWKGVRLFCAGPFVSKKTSRMSGKICKTGKEGPGLLTLLFLPDYLDVRKFK